MKQVCIGGSGGSFGNDVTVKESPLFEYLNNENSVAEGVYNCWLSKDGEKNEATLLGELGRINFSLNDQAYHYNGGSLVSSYNGWGPQMEDIYEYIMGDKGYYTIAKENNKYVLAAVYKAVNIIINNSTFESSGWLSSNDNDKIKEIIPKLKDEKFLQKLRAAISYKKTVLGNEMYEDSDRFTTSDQKKGYLGLKEIENSITSQGVNIGDSEEDKLSYSSEQLGDYLGLFGERLNPETYADSNQLLEQIRENIKDNEKITDQELDNIIEKRSSIKQAEVKTVGADGELYELPSRLQVGTSGISVDNTINNADNFINIGDNNTIEWQGLMRLSSSIHGILLTAGVIVAIIVGLIIGIKFMLGSVEEKADVKKLLIPYLVGCVVVFGSLGIWAAIVEILGQL